jgi:hypothetical protein
VDELPPLLAACRLTSRRGDTKVKLALAAVAPLKLTLFVVNAPQGGDSHQVSVPQSITPVGYCPFSTRSWPERLSNVTVCVDGVFVGVGVIVGVLVLVGVSVCVGVFVSVGIAVDVLVGPPGVAVDVLVGPPGVAVDVLVRVSVGVLVAVGLAPPPGPPS